MKKPILNKIFNTLFLFAVFGFTLWSVFANEDFGQVLHHLQTANFLYVIPGIACVILFILGEAVIIRYLMGTLGTRVKMSHCCLYSFIGFFYSAITPSASGGQPMQIIAMRKDRIPVAVSTVVLAIVTITYKMVLVVIGVAVMVLRPKALMVYLEPVQSIIYLGLALNIVCIAGLLMLVFCPRIVRVLTLKTLALINKIKPIRNMEKQNARLERIVTQYEGTAEFFLSHKRVMLRVFLLTLAQRVILFLVTWFTYLAFDLSGHSMPLIVTLQAMISVAADMLPLPGGMGVSETLFLDIFPTIFGESLVLPGMMISRGISYYTQMLLSAVMTVVASFIIRDRSVKKEIERQKEP